MNTCPRCHRPLRKERTDRGLLHRCDGCGGMWANMAVLRRYIEPDEINSLWQRARKGQGTASCACPVCRNAMLQLPAMDRARPLVDVCGRCHLVWFDAEEWHALPHRPEPEPIPERQESPEVAMASIRLGGDLRRDERAPEQAWRAIPGFLGLPVESKQELRHGIPWVTLSLAALVTMAHLLAWIESPAMQDLAKQVSAGSLVARFDLLFGVLFLHGGLLHLVVNVYFLVVFGDNVEDYLGPMRFVVLILAAVFAGNWAFFTLAGEPAPVAIGSDSAVGAVVVFYALAFPHAQVHYAFKHTWLKFPAYAGGAIWVGLQVLAVTMLAGSSWSWGYLANLGGVAVGGLYWLFWSEGPIERRCAAPRGHRYFRN